MSKGSKDTIRGRSNSRHGQRCKFDESEEETAEETLELEELNVIERVAAKTQELGFNKPDFQLFISGRFYFFFFFFYLKNEHNWKLESNSSSMSFQNGNFFGLQKYVLCCAFNNNNNKNKKRRPLCLLAKSSHVKRFNLLMII